MTWIVALLGTGGDAGALAFARWLARTHDGGCAVVPVRVLDAEYLRVVLRYRGLRAAVDRERAALGDLGAALPEAGVPPEVLPATTLAEGLEQARARHDATGIVIARAAEGGSRLFRLGAPTRGLLARLTCPVIVVPPELTLPRIGAGPVVAVSTLSAESVTACRLARGLADGLRRDLAILHVAGERRATRAGAAADAAADPARPERALATWVARHAVWPDLTAVVGGEPATATLAWAEARRAPLVAVGARPSGRLRDAIGPAPWRRLTAHASQPVLVVPPAAAEATAALGLGAAT